MRFILPLFLFGMLATSCIDNNYDLSEIDTDGVVIGDEFRLPLATVTVSMSELGKDGTDIKALFDEADIWLPSPLPAGGNTWIFRRFSTPRPISTSCSTN